MALGGGGTQVNYIYRGDLPFTSILYGIQALLVPGAGEGDAREVVNSMLLKTMRNVFGRKKRRPNFRGYFFDGSERIDPSSTNPTPAGTAKERTAIKVAPGGGGTQVNYIYRVDPFYQHPVWDSGAAGLRHRELWETW